MITIYSGVEDCNLDSSAFVVFINNRSTDTVNTPWKLLFSCFDSIISFNVVYMWIPSEPIHSFRWDVRCYCINEGV